MTYLFSSVTFFFFLVLHVKLNGYCWLTIYKNVLHRWEKWYYWISSLLYTLTITFNSSNAKKAQAASTDWIYKMIMDAMFIESGIPVLPSFKKLLKYQDTVVFKY